MQLIKTQLFILLTSIVMSLSAASYAQNYKVDPEVTKNAPYSQGKIINEGFFNESTPMYRVFMGVNSEGHWIVQDFYLEDKRVLTDPFLIIPRAEGESGKPTLYDYFPEPLYVKVERVDPYYYLGSALYEKNGPAIHGPLRVWSVGGVKLLEAHYKEGHAHGSWMQWDETGRLYQKTEYADGFLAAPLMSYHENGELASEAFYTSGGCRTGQWRYWNEQGQQISEIPFKNGKVSGNQKNWHPNGQLAYEGEFGEWRKLGVHTAWYDNGQKKEEHTYLAGELSGSSAMWSEQGLLIRQGDYLANHKEGLWNTWHHNGNKRDQGHYRDGYKVGGWQFWDEEGALIERVSYPMPSPSLGNVKKPIVATHSFYAGKGAQVQTYRIFLETTPEGYFIVQDFYQESHQPFSEPFTLLRLEDVKKAVDNNSRTLEEIAIIGKLTLRYSNGKVWVTADFHNGKMHGDWKLWDEEGQLSAYKTYAKGMALDSRMCQ